MSANEVAWGSQSICEITSLITKLEPHRSPRQARIDGRTPITTTFTYHPAAGLICSRSVEFGASTAADRWRR